ncbi:hypothetical protein [uncultured Flavobacterium sp.]|uniref:hypothetical protein n=1 Tax=uncultured Flavobacterium sp. TaxID=165435 RepID=UPI0025E0287F|nr:hypothetical protein [uncultured Flavobacterium sp.]
MNKILIIIGFLFSPAIWAQDSPEQEVQEELIKIWQATLQANPLALEQLAESKLLDSDTFLILNPYFEKDSLSYGDEKIIPKSLIRLQLKSKIINELLFARQEAQKNGNLKRKYSTFGTSTKPAGEAPYRKLFPSNKKYSTHVTLYATFVKYKTSWYIIKMDASSFKQNTTGDE